MKSSALHDSVARNFIHFWMEIKDAKTDTSSEKQM